MGKAVRLGRALGLYLADLTGPGGEPAEVILVAHSLGCRLALEALRVLQDFARWQPGRVPAVCLMAAAVDVGMLGYGDRFWSTAEVAGRSWVLYSRSDVVLHRTFPAGQWLAGEGASEAVGYRGAPPEAWTGRDETMLGHGDYWASPVTTPHLARLFGVATREELPSLAPVAWPGPPANRLGENRLG